MIDESTIERMVQLLELDLENAAEFTHHEGKYKLQKSTIKAYDLEVRDTAGGMLALANVLSGMEDKEALYVKYRTRILRFFKHP